MEIGKEFADPHFNAKAWLNQAVAAASAGAGGGPSNSEKGSAGSTAETAISEIHTRLQMQTQELSSSLEAVITQALSRLPRTAAEIERMSAEAQLLATQLGDVINETAPAMASIPSEVQRLRDLHRVKEKLAYCTDILQQVNTLQARVEEVERALTTFEVGAGKELNVDALADRISATRGTLEKLREIDPSFGKDLAARVSGFQSQLQERLERECLECLKRQDAERAPRLLGTLRTIKRDAAVLEKYINGSAQHRRQQFFTDLAAAPSSSVATVLAGYYRGVLKAISRERGYFATILDSPAAVDGIQQQLQSFLLGDVGDRLLERLRGVGSSELVECFTATRVLEQLSRAAVADAEKPFTSLMAQFISGEEEAVHVVVGRASEGELALVTNAVEASVTRCSKFFPETTIPKMLIHWNAALVAFSKRHGGTSGMRNASGGRDAESLKELFASLTIVRASMRELQAFEAQLLAKFAKLFPPLPPSTDAVSAASPSNTVGSSYFGKGLDALAAAAAHKERLIGDVITHPILSRLEGYASDPVWMEASGVKGRSGRNYSAGQVAPTEKIRGATEEVMELPLRFEGLGLVEGADVQPWLTLAVSSFVQRFTDAIRAAPITSRRSIEQAIADVEYALNVLMAISDATFEELHAIMEGLQGLDDVDAVLARAEAAASSNGKSSSSAGDTPQPPPQGKSLTIGDLVDGEGRAAVAA